MELYTNFYKILVFMKMYLPSSLILRYYYYLLLLLLVVVVVVVVVVIWQSPGLPGWRKVNLITVTRRPHHPSMLGLRWMCRNLWMNLIKKTIDIQEKLKILKIYVQSQWRVVLLWYHMFWQSSIQRGRHTQIFIITSLKWLIHICSNFFWWVCKIAFYLTNPHRCLGKLPL